MTFLLYWSLKNYRLKAQNSLLILANYIFYGWWDLRFLLLIVFSSFVDYLVGLALLKNNKSLHRKLFLLASIFTNLGVLLFFKYFNFFAQSFSEAFTFFGQKTDLPELNIILPVGISFYTFQTMSYSIDVYRREIQPTKDIVAFFAFVSFFPQLVAGPIERAKNLLVQFNEKRTFCYEKAVDGMRQILWGLFKKIVIADNCAVYVNDIFTNYAHYSGSTLLLGATFFAFQIYGDFSGYSDIAIGTARLFGFSLMRNFAFPYFSRDIAEFWRRWHISLSSWFKDYLYIPLGGSRGSKWLVVRNIFIIFIISGFWHGASWNFIAWGFIHACYFLPLLLLKQNRKNMDTVASGKVFPSVQHLFQMLITFSLVTIAWLFFRAETLTQAVLYIFNMFSWSIISIPEILSLKMCFCIVFIIIFLAVEWLQRGKQHALQLTDLPFSSFIRKLFYLVIIACIAWFGGNEQEFIYFQF